MSTQKNCFAVVTVGPNRRWPKHNRIPTCSRKLKWKKTHWLQKRSIESRECRRSPDISLCGCQHCWWRTTKRSQRPQSKHGGNKCWGEEGQWGENKLLSRQLSLPAATVNNAVYVGNIRRLVNGEMSKPTVPTFTPRGSERHSLI